MTRLSLRVTVGESAGSITVAGIADPGFFNTVVGCYAAAVTISGSRSRHGCLYRFSLRRNFSRSLELSQLVILPP